MVVVLNMIYVIRTMYRCWKCLCYGFFFQAEDGIRDLVRSRGLGDVYKRQGSKKSLIDFFPLFNLIENLIISFLCFLYLVGFHICLLYTSDAADDLLCVDLGGRRIIKNKKPIKPMSHNIIHITSISHTL